MRQQISKQCFNTTLLNNYATIRLPNRLIALESVVFQKAFFQLIEEVEVASEIILDLTDTQFIDGGGIGALISARNIAQEKKCKLILHQVKPTFN